VKFHLQVVESDIVNAFALPGGEMIVFTGLLAKAKQPEQVAGVLAHEMAHVTLRHGLQRIGQSLGIVTVAQLLIGDVGGLVALGTQILTTAAINSYSREQETQADLEGLRMLREAGINPLALAEFFDMMQAAGDGKIPEGMVWLSTHPDHRARIQAIQDEMKKHPTPNTAPLGIDWPAVQAHLAPASVSGTTGPTEE
jgi:predicted Zn-dependent protease